MSERKYNLKWFRGDTGASGYFNDPRAPMTHKEACIFKSKLTSYPWRTEILVEAQ